MPDIILKKKSSIPVNGVIEEPQLPIDRWLVGASGLEYFNLNNAGDWLQFKPTNEKQNRGLETYTCTNQWGLSSFETQLIFRIKNGLLSQRAIDFLEKYKFFDKEGNPNFSDKAAAILTGTIYGRGNYVYKTPDMARNIGLIPESMLQFGNPKTWEEFINPKQITKEMLAVAEESKTIFAVEYETIPTAGRTKSEIRADVRHHIHQAPLSITIPICPGYNNSELIAACNKTPIHCVGLMADFGNRQAIFDSYDPFVKNLAEDYNIPYFLKAVISERDGYSTVEVAEAKRFALQISKSNNTEYIFRSDAHGEAYYIEPDGSLVYKHQPGGKLMDHMIKVTKDIIPVSEKDWRVLKPALKK